MYKLKIEIKSINDDKLNLINKSFKNMLSLDREVNYESIIESYNVEKTSVERMVHIRNILIQEIFNKFGINQIGDITAMMLRIMIKDYEDEINQTNIIKESSKWESLHENIEVLKDIARDLYLDIN